MNDPRTAGSLQLYDVDEVMRPTVECIATGWSEELEDQLIQKSREPNTVRYTPNDHKKRFGDRQMLAAWKSRGRIIHWLLGPHKDLAGIIWYGASEFPYDLVLPEVPEETFAIRIYDGFAGQGLARPFMTQSLRIYVQQKQSNGEEVSPIWLQTDLDNPAALAAYTKFGYEEVHRDDKRVTMIISSRKIQSIVGI